jgi:hypothetical protein
MYGNGMTPARLKARLRSALSSHYDPNGGIAIPEDGIERARNAELITLPNDVRGKNCHSCVFMGSNGMCEHPEVRLAVNARQGCKYWTAPGIYKAWKEE